MNTNIQRSGIISIKNLAYDLDSPCVVFFVPIAIHRGNFIEVCPRLFWTVVFTHAHTEREREIDRERETDRQTDIHTYIHTLQHTITNYSIPLSHWLFGKTVEILEHGTEQIQSFYRRCY